MTTTALPRWDMSTIYAGLDDPALAADTSAFFEAVERCAALLDRHGVAARQPAPLTDSDVAAFGEAAAALGDLRERMTTLRAYLYSFVSTDSRDQAAQGLMSALQERAVALDLLFTRFTAWVGGVDVDALVARSEVAAAHAHMLRRAREEAAHLMSPAEEELAAELGPSGGQAWGRLHADITSQLLVPLDLGERRELPMSVVRNLAYDADRARREAAYRAELAAWRRAEVPLAAAMNGIKGEVTVLARRRGWGDPLDEALFDNAIDRETLDAMLTAARESFPAFRRYLRAKARALGLGGAPLPWYDMFAPLATGAAQAWDYEAAREFILGQFESFAPHMRALAERAFGESWIDAEPREGKVGGAFCMPVRAGESRILSNYTESISGVVTLAHELGHAYHNRCLAINPPLIRSAPMTLAETASIFCETVVRQAALAVAPPDEQLAIVEAALMNSCQIVVDITSRFLFERAAFAGRRQRALSAAELSAAMLDAQRQTYGDGLDPEALHPYMWAAKPHYYSAGRSFYNFPYMFGLLFGTGLYAIGRREPQGFVERYDTLLASTGQADAATLAARVGIDIRSPDFWRASLATITADVDRFEALVGAGPS